MVILKKHSQKLSTSDNQFGFKNGSPVYAMFLDASKAFDRLKFVKLFEKLEKKVCVL